MQNAALKQTAQAKDRQILKTSIATTCAPPQSDCLVCRNLAEDFLGSNPDGSIVDRAEFLRRWTPYQARIPRPSTCASGSSVRCTHPCRIQVPETGGQMGWAATPTPMHGAGSLGLRFRAFQRF